MGSGVASDIYLDDETAGMVARLAAEWNVSADEVVRRAVSRLGTSAPSGDVERRRRGLRLLEELMASPPTRSQDEALAEIEEIRAARRALAQSSR